MSPSKAAIQAMRRIAEEKAGQPEGEVARRKLERLGVSHYHGFLRYFKVNRVHFEQAMYGTWPSTGSFRPSMRIKRRIMVRKVWNEDKQDWETVHTFRY